jgi:hypothetical protein
MKARLAVCATAALAVVWPTSAIPQTRTVASSATPPVAGVAAAIHAEAAAYNARDWRKLWNLLGPRYRSMCSYNKWLASETHFRENGGTIAITGTIRVTSLSAKRALADYHMTTQSHQKIHNSRDLFVRRGDRWLDEMDDPQAGCQFYQPPRTG